jgi:hypothetical protein
VISRTGAGFFSGGTVYFLGRMPATSQPLPGRSAPNRTGCPPHRVSADQLETLSRVLREALAATLANVLQRSDEAVEELTSRLGKVIIDQFATGESDPELLKVQ